MLRPDKKLEPGPLPFHGVQINQDEEEEEGWILKDSQLLSLRESEEIKKLLKDKKLQKLLLEIDASKDRQKLLISAIENDTRFAMFANTIIATIGLDNRKF